MPKPANHDRFDRVYAANLSAILGYAVRRCADPADAADVAAEVFLVAWRRLDEVPAGEERLWLFGIARRVLANHQRGRLRRNRLADRLRSELATQPRSTLHDDTHAAVIEAMNQLSPRDREVLRLAAWDGLTPAEIATLENVPAATIRSQLMRARNRLRESLRDHGVEPALQRSAPGGHVSAGAPLPSPTSGADQ